MAAAAGPLPDLFDCPFALSAPVFNECEGESMQVDLSGRVVVLREARAGGWHFLQFREVKGSAVGSASGRRYAFSGTAALESDSRLSGGDFVLATDADAHLSGRAETAFTARVEERVTLDALGH